MCLFSQQNNKNGMRSANRRLRVKSGEVLGKLLVKVPEWVFG